MSKEVKILKFLPLLLLASPPTAFFINSSLQNIEMSKEVKILNSCLIKSYAPAAVGVPANSLFYKFIFTKH